MQLPKPRHRIPLWLWAILAVLGLILALVGLIPVVGDIIDPVSEAFFDFVFFLRKAPITSNTSVLITSFIGVLLGFIPEVGDFISDIIELNVKIHLIRKEDRQFNKQQPAAEAERQNQIRQAQEEEWDREDAEDNARIQAQAS